MGKKLRVHHCEVCDWPFKALRDDARCCTSSCRSRLARVKLGQMTMRHAVKLARDLRALRARRRVFGKR